MPTPPITPNMSLTEPVVDQGNGGTLAPGWALLLNANFSTIDSHNHTAGKGVPIPPSGLDISTDLTFQGNNLTHLNSAVFNGAVTGTPSLLSIYSDGTDFYFKDVNGNSIQLTKAGSPNAGTGNIQGLPSTPVGGAGISWVNAQSTFQLLADNGTSKASLDAATVILRYPGSYPTPAGNFIALQAPASLSSPYALTLSPTAPSTDKALLLTASSGVQSYLSKGAANTVLRMNSGGTDLEYNTVDTANITNLAVTTAKIDNGAVTPPKLSATNNSSVGFSATNTNTGAFLCAVPFTASGIRPVLITVQGPLASTDASWGGTTGAGGATAAVEATLAITSANTSNLIQIWRTGWQISGVLTNFNFTVPLGMSVIFFPPAGADTYNVVLAKGSNANTAPTTLALIDAGVVTFTEL